MQFFLIFKREKILIQFSKVRVTEIENFKILIEIFIKIFLEIENFKNFNIQMRRENNLVFN